MADFFRGDLVAYGGFGAFHKCGGTRRALCRGPEGAPTVTDEADDDPMALAARRAQALYERDGACRALGIALKEVAPGRATVTMRVAGEMTNGHGIGHGGYVFLLADAAFSFACNTYRSNAVAHGAQVTFLRPVAVGDELIAEAVERQRYGRSGIYDVTVRRPGGEVVAEFRGQSQLLAGRPSGLAAETGREEEAR